MKKVIFAALMLMGGLTAFAQDTEANVNEEAAEETTVVAEAQDDYSEISVEELPEAVTAAVQTNYPTATIDKAYKNESNEYKLEVSLQDGTAGTLYADESGNWIE